MSEEGFQNKAFDFAKKVIAVGVGTAFLTEEALRTLVAEFKLPKELMGGLLENAKTARIEFIQSFAQEMMTKLSEKADPAALMAEFFKKNEVTFEVKLKVRDKNDTTV